MLDYADGWTKMIPSETRADPTVLKHAALTTQMGRIPMWTARKAPVASELLNTVPLQSHATTPKSIGRASKQRSGWEPKRNTRP
jgi:hypothetical protein